MKRREPEEQAVSRRKNGTFAPGVSGNPGGRKPGQVSLATLLRRKLEEVPEGEKRTFAELLVLSTLEASLLGDPQARRLIWEYCDGRPTTRLELTGQQPIEDPIADLVLSGDKEARAAYDLLLCKISRSETHDDERSTNE